jgi:hypothetical protein
MQNWAMASARPPAAQKNFFDDFACLEIAMHAGGYADPLVWKPGRDMEGFEKVPVCTVAGWLADSGNVKGNSRPAIIERLRKQFKKREQDYLYWAGLFTRLICLGKIFLGLPETDRAEVGRVLADHEKYFPLISQLFRPTISMRRAEIISKLAELNAEIKELFEEEGVAIDQLAVALERESPIQGLTSGYWRTRAIHWPFNHDPMGSYRGYSIEGLRRQDDK